MVVLRNAQYDLVLLHDFTRLPGFASKTNVFNMKEVFSVGSSIDDVTL